MKSKQIIDSTLLTSVVAGVGAGLFYKYATDGLNKGGTLPSEIKSELDALCDKLEGFFTKVQNDIELKEMNETITQFSTEANIQGIIDYASERLQINKELLGDTEKLEETLKKIREMSVGLSDSTQIQLGRVVDGILAIDLSFKSLLHVQHAIFECIHHAYVEMREQGVTTLPDEPKLKMQDLGKKYSEAIIRVKRSCEVLQGEKPSSAPAPQPPSTEWGAIAYKLLVGVFSILGAILIAVISVVGKSMQGKK